MVILEWIAKLFRWLAGAIVPMFVRPISPVGLAWFLHVVLVIAAAIGLKYAQPHLGITVNLGKGPPALRPYWLPILFLLGYSLLWAIARLWALLAPNQQATIFPDLDEEWGKITEALSRAGIGVADTPLFFVFGQLSGGFDNFFRALPHGLTVSGATGSNASLQVFANRDGIYLTVAGACLLGVQDRGGLPTYTTDESGGSVYGTVGMNQSVGIGASVGAGSIGGSIAGTFGGSIAGSRGAAGPLQQIQVLIRKARQENRELTDAEKKRVRDLSGSAPDSGGRDRDPVGGAVGSVLQNPMAVDEAAARLTHICGLIGAARWPLCPINGVVLAVPMSAAEKDEAAQQWGLVARQDIAVAEAATKQRFPVYTIVGGVENLPGGQTFFERFAADKGGQRLGKGFPLNPEIKPDVVGEAVESSVGWVFNSLLPYWAFRLMRVDGNVSSDTKDNAGLVRFLAEVRRRGPHLSRLVSRAVVLYGDVIPEFGGCYLTVSLQSDPADAKFAKEFFKKVESSQGYVAWTDEAIAEDAAFRRSTFLGHVALGAVLLGVIAFGGYVIYTKFGK